MRSLALTCVGLVGLACGGAESVRPAKETLPPPSAPAEAVASPVTPAVSDARALVLVDGSLAKMAPDGSTEVLADAANATECAFDDSHAVVWLVSDSELRAYDPSDGAVHDVVTGVPKAADGIDWQVRLPAVGSTEGTVTASNVTGLEACVSMVVSVGPTPQAAGVVIAEGDREWYCFADDSEIDKAPKDRTLNSEEAAVKARYDRAKLVGAPFLQALAQRLEQQGPVKRPTLAAPAAPTPTVDKSACEENEDDCGRATYLGGDRLWRVVTSNSRGDFYVEGRTLFDSKEAAWWDPSTGKHSAAPQDVESDALLVSPDGLWGVSGKAIVSLRDAAVTGPFNGTVCGWLP